MRVTVVRRASAAAPAATGVADEATPESETSTSAPATAYPVQRDHRRAMTSCLSSCPPAGPDEPNGWHRALPAFALRVGGCRRRRATARWAREQPAAAMGLRRGRRARPPLHPRQRADL